MASGRLVDRPVQLRQDDSDEEVYYSSDQVLSERSLEVTDDESRSQSDDEAVDADTSEEDAPSSQASGEEPDDLKNISFGALAKAQASFAPSNETRKRKRTSLQTPTDVPLDKPHPTRDTISKKPDQDLTHRTSKHAPTILSSRHPVSRKRSILSPPPTSKSRDPRFDPAITSRTLNEQSIASASKAYSFLTDYQATEILALKAEIQKTQPRDPSRADELKKQLMSMESRLRNVETKKKEREVLARHKAQEKQAIREGKKSRAYFLKPSEVRREVERERVEGMGKRQKDKMEKRRRMREKKKEARDMPWARRMG